MQLTDFHKVFEDEILQYKANRNSDVQKHPLVRQFKEAVWVCFLSILSVRRFLPFPFFSPFSLVLIRSWNVEYV